MTETHESTAGGVPAESQPRRKDPVIRSIAIADIGDAFAGRDHTTVLHACRQIRTLMETDGKLREDWDKLIRKLSE